MAMLTKLTKLTKLFLVWTAMTMVATALVVSSNITSRQTRWLHKRTPLPHDYGVSTPNTLRMNKETGEPENTYTAQQIDQFQQGHMEALMLCRKVIEASTRQADHFGRISGEYFPTTDRELILKVFKSILGPQGKGNPKFAYMDVVDDFQPDFDRTLDQHCTDISAAEVVDKKWDISMGRTQLILCPNLFGYGTIEGGKGKEWPGAKERKCSNIGDRVSRYMLTLGSMMLHEYMHATELVQPPLKQPVVDHVYSFYKARHIKDKKLAKSNADSYSLFAAELTCTLLCDRDFAPPAEDNSPILPATDSKATDSKATDNKGANTKGTNSKQQRPRHEIQSAPSLQKRTAFSQPYEHPMMIMDWDNTYTVEQMDQFLEAHIDALHLCSVVIEQAERDTDSFNRIFREYFKPDDRELVVDVFKAILDYDGAKQGSQKFNDVYLVDDHVYGHGTDRKWRCGRKFTGAVTMTRRHDEHPTWMILCKFFFMIGTIEGVPGKNPDSCARQVTCDVLGRRVSIIMETMGQWLLHEYTHMADIMQPILGEGLIEVGNTYDHTYGFANCRSLDKELATRNADSYASFASELFWTTKCDRDFDPPQPMDQRPGYQAFGEMLIRLGVAPTEEQFTAAEGETMEETFTRLGFLVDIPPIPEDDSSEEEDSNAEVFSHVEGDSTVKVDSAAKGGPTGTGALTAKGASAAKGVSAVKGSSIST